MKKNIGIIGIGKLGLCFALNLEKKYNVIGCDINQNYVNSINQKTLISTEPKVNEMLKLSKNFTATTDIKHVVDECETIFILVATPSLANGKYDHSAVDAVIDQIISFNKKCNIIIGCTVMPTYCEKLYGRLKYYGINLAYNPEFIAQGDIINGQINPDIVLIGESNTEIGDLVEEIHKSIITNNAKICRMKLTESEIVKIALNCFCTIKISYANMIGDLAVSANCNPDVVLNAIGQDSRVGKKYLKYGDGFGGPCFPRDNRALNSFANEQGVQLKLSEVVDETNKLHLKEQIKRIIENEKYKTEDYVIESITYKKGTDIIEESQRLALAVELAKLGVSVVVRDEKDILDKVRKIHGSLLKYEEK